jgi:dihydropteroate synthase
LNPSIVAKDTVFSSKKTWNIRGSLVDFNTPSVMGILNCTPDSFYKGSRFSTRDALQTAEKMLVDGARFLDVGGYSSRPGAEDVDMETEWSRVGPLIRELAHEFPEALVSIDTFRSEVAIRAINEGASVVNDISGGDLDQHMFETIARLKTPYIIMHMRGTPQTMKALTNYDQLIPEITHSFVTKMNRLHALGVVDIAIDPGFGFAKTTNQNYEILKNLRYFHALNAPILVGVSRKSMIFKTLEIPPEDSLNGTTVLNTIALMEGASLLRVHDVKEAVEAIRLVQKVKQPY